MHTFDDATPATEADQSLHVHTCFASKISGGGMSPLIQLLSSSFSKHRCEALEQDINPLVSAFEIDAASQCDYDSSFFLT